jgi:L-threonylcarbamoyladenylate synthase
MPEFLDDIEQSLIVLRKGGTILYPTDTVWGIGCDATNPMAVKRIFDLKIRPDSRSFIILLADEGDLVHYIHGPGEGPGPLSQKFSSPTTVIYSGAKGLASNLIQSDGTVGIRIVQEPFCQALIKAFGKPVVSTSANISGSLTPGNYKEIHSSILDGVDYIVKFRQEDRTLAHPSRVIRYNPDGSVTIIRP